MAISDEDKNRVRAASDLVQVASDHMVLRQKGREFWGCCPFHGEKTPSFKIDPNTQLFHCFGCGEGGDVFTFVQKIENVEFLDAVRFLARRAGIELDEEKGSGVTRGHKARLKELCKETAEFYHMQLMRSKSSQAAAARTYLASRQLNGTIPKDWDLGFAPGNRMLVNHLRSKGFRDAEMIEANVAANGKGGIQDRFFNRIMFPIRDVSGDFIAFGGRVIGKGEPKYLNTSETPLFHKSEILYALDRAKSAMTATGTAIIVEGYTDVIVLHEAGIKNAVATLGTALTTQHIRAISRHAKNRIVYLFDGDAAGQRAADRALQFIDESMIPESGRKQVDLLAVTLPDDLDPADFVTQRGSEALNELIDSAQPLIRYGIDRRLEGYDPNDFESRSRVLVEALKVLAPIKKSVLAQEYAGYIASRLHLDEDTVLRKLSTLEGASRMQENAAASPEPIAAATAVPALSPKDRERLRTERQLLAVCVFRPEYIEEASRTLSQTYWHRTQFSMLAAKILAEAGSLSSMSPSERLASLEADVRGATAQMTAAMPSMEDDLTSLCKYLEEELAIGDYEQDASELLEKLGNDHSLSEDDQKIIHASVMAIQAEVANLRANRTSL